MKPEQSAAAAKILYDLRAQSRVIAALDPDLTPQTIACAYQIQDDFRGLWPHPCAGWKIGATAGPVQAKFGVSEPFAGPVYASDVYRTPARPLAAGFPHLCLESEFAFRFTTPLPPRGDVYTRDEIADAIGAVIPALELVGPRFSSLLYDAVYTAAADCALNAGFVLGEPVADWRTYDYPSHPVVLSVDGKPVVRGTGSNVLGNPLIVLDWAVNHLSQRGIAIESGQFISTGTTTGLFHVKPNQVAVADFGRIGSLEVRFAGEPHPQWVTG